MMLQLDWLSDDGQSLRYPDRLRAQLTAAKRAGIKGVMARAPAPHGPPRPPQGERLRAAMALEAARDELWPPPLWPGHFCRKSLLQLRDSSGLAAQLPPYSFAMRYDLRPLTKQPPGL